LIYSDRVNTLEQSSLPQSVNVPNNQRTADVGKKKDELAQEVKLFRGISHAAKERIESVLEGGQVSDCVTLKRMNK
jgi:hypothetical protein